MATDYVRAGWSGDRIPVETRFSAPVQTGPGATQPPVQWLPGLSRGVKYGRDVLLTTQPLLVPWSWKSTAIPLPTSGPHRACNGITLSCSSLSRPAPVPTQPTIYNHIGLGYSEGQRRGLQVDSSCLNTDVMTASSQYCTATCVVVASG
jgi:hypothetical protein